MGRGARFACIFLPLCATVATAVLVILGAFIGQTDKSNGTTNSLYFLRVDTRNINRGNIDLIPGTNVDNVVAGLTGTDTTIGNGSELAGIAQFYQAGLFSYCRGSFDASNKTTVTACSKPKLYFSFDLIDIINSDIDGNVTYPKAVTDAFKAINAVSHVQSTLLYVGIIATLVEFAVGWFGLFSRIGSCITTLVANVAFIFLLAGGVVNIVLYASIEGAFKATYHQLGLQATLHNHNYALYFIGVALSLGAAIFWLFSSCCCSGRRDRVVRGDRRDRGGEKGFGRNANYEMLPPQQTPMLGQGGFAPDQHSTSYEPMRHGRI